jgi:hypothetical protein
MALSKKWIVFGVLAVLFVLYWTRSTNPPTIAATMRPRVRSSTPRSRGETLTRRKTLQRRRPLLTRTTTSSHLSQSSARTPSSLPIGLKLPEQLDKDPVYLIYQQMASDSFPTHISNDERAAIHKSGGETLYGELTMLGCEQLFTRVKLGPSSVFYDFGCGSGKGVLKAHTWGARKAVGIELSTTRYASAIRALDALRKSPVYDRTRDVHFENVDMFTFDVSDADVVFLNMYNAGVVQKVADHIRKSCKLGTIFATMFPITTLSGWEWMEPPLKLRMSWSTVNGTAVHIYTLRKSGISKS